MRTSYTKSNNVKSNLPCQEVGCDIFAFLDLILGTFKQPFSGNKILGAREKTEGDSI